MSIKKLLKLLDMTVFITAYTTKKNEPIYGIPKSLYEEIRVILEDLEADAAMHEE